MTVENVVAVSLASLAVLYCYFALEALWGREFSSAAVSMALSSSFIMLAGCLK